MHAELRKRLEAFDGLHTDTLEAIAATLTGDPQTINALCHLALSDERKLQSASTWLLKRLSESGIRPSQAQSEALLSLLLRQSHWEAQLHVLQMIDALTLSEDDLPAVWTRLIDLTSEAKKMIRAWSYHGIAILADQHWEYRAEAMELLERGAADEAPSVRARIRRLRKACKWLGTEKP